MLKLFRVKFTNGWSTIVPANDTETAKVSAIENYGCWFPDNPEIVEIETSEYDWKTVFYKGMSL